MSITHLSKDQRMVCTIYTALILEAQRTDYPNECMSEIKSRRQVALNHRVKTIGKNKMTSQLGCLHHLRGQYQWSLHMLKDILSNDTIIISIKFIYELDYSFTRHSYHSEL